MGIKRKEHGAKIKARAALEALKGDKAINEIAGRYEVHPMALTLNAKKNKLKRADFESLADNLKIDPKAAANSFEKIKNAREKFRELVIYSELNSSMRQEFEDVLAERFKRLFS